MSDLTVSIMFLGGLFTVAIVVVVCNFKRSAIQYEVLSKMIERGCDPVKIKDTFSTVTPHDRLLIAGIILAGIGVGLILTGIAGDVGIIKPPAEMLAPSGVPGSGYTPVRIDFGDYGPGCVFLTLGLSMILAWHIVRKGIERGRESGFLSQNP